MMKRLMLYTVLGVCLFSACQQEELGEAGIATDTAGLRLTVSASDFVPADSAATRAFDDGRVTTFESGNQVGLIILDGSNNLRANNLPYTFDGTSWTTTGTAPCYDPMVTNDYTYLVYYPYTASANGMKTVEELKKIITPQTDQSSENAYRQSDLMVGTGTVAREINATLSHAYASYSLSPVIKTILDDTSQSAISYVPNTLEEVVFQDGEGEYIQLYRAEDGSYRYILPTDYKGTIRWFYNYEEKRYGGTWESTGVTANTRYSRVEVVKDFGNYTPEKARLGDFYCRDAQGRGYLFPSEATYAHIDYECIGAVIATGHSQYDTSDYSTSGIEQKECHGYVAALEDAQNSVGLWGVVGKALRLYPKDTDGSTPLDNVTKPDIDWSGYAYTQVIIETVGGKENLSAQTDESSIIGYPTTYYAVVAYDERVPAPTNSSGWFLPSIGQLKTLHENRSYITAAGGTVGWGQFWNSSSEKYDDAADQFLNFWVRGASGKVNPTSKNTINYIGYDVRSVLAF